MNHGKLKSALLLLACTATLVGCGTYNHQAALEQSQETKVAYAAEQKAPSKKSRKHKQPMPEQAVNQAVQQLISSTYHFKHDSTELTQSAKAELDQFAQYLAQNEKAKVHIEGYTDAKGKPSYNLALGMRRAQSIAEYLQQQGVKSSQIETRSFGADKPAKEGMASDALASNRRAVVYFEVQSYVFESPLIQAFPREIPGILTLGGGRQIGKTTLLKQWMADLLAQGVVPEAICFLSGELISDHQMLYHLVIDQLSRMPTDTLKYLIIDEVTYIHDWDKAIKYLAETGAFETVVCVLSGSDLVLMQDARKRFPGRRGKAPTVDFHYYPLSFAECLKLKGLYPDTVESPDYGILYREFDRYLIHGGFLTAINEFEQEGSIRPATLTTYSDWIRGDMLKRYKKEIHLKEITAAILKHYMKQISWDNLVKELSIDHAQTVSDYVNLLCAMDACFVQSAIMEDKLTAAPKKRKKIMFCDPFIYHAMRAWLIPAKDPFDTQIKALFSDPVQYADLVESCVVTQFRRFYETYYIKAEGEVDVAYVKHNRMWPVEVKWTNQIRPQDLKQILKYKNGVVFSKQSQRSSIQHLEQIPLPLGLLLIETQ